MSEQIVGPWIGADESGHFKPDHEWNVTNEDCAMCSSLPIWEGDEVIAFVVYRSDDWYKNEPKIVDARARLIAAAPVTLKALQDLYAAYCSVMKSEFDTHRAEWTPERDNDKAALDAQAAIAKATGEPA